MSHAQWVAERGADSPGALVARVQGVLSAHPEWRELSVAEALLRAGESLLAAVLATGEGKGREVALDLLAADACVTWAFEAAADDVGSLGERAVLAMRRIEEVAR